MPSRSWNTSTWPSVAGPAPMPITGISISPISSSVTALGIASKTIAKQPASCSARASAAIRAAARALRPWAFQPPSAVEVWGVRPTWPITGMPAPTIARARLAGASPPPSSLTTSQPPSLTIRIAVAIACSSETS